MPDRPRAITIPEPQEQLADPSVRERFMAMTEEQRLAHIDRYGMDIVLDEIRD